MNVLGLILASGYDLGIRAWRLVTREWAPSAVLALLGGWFAFKGVPGAIRVLDVASIHLPERAHTLRLGTSVVLFVGIIGLVGFLGARLSAALPLRRYLHLPYRFETLYSCHMLWSLVGWWLLFIPLFQWLAVGLDSGPAAHGALLVLRWLAVVMFVLATNAWAEALGLFLELRLRRASRWLLAVALIIVASAAVSEASLRGWAVPLTLGVLRWTPPGNLAAALNAETTFGVVWPLALLMAYSGLGASLGTRLAKRAYLHRVQGPWRGVGFGDETSLERVWERICAVGASSALAALVAREAVSFFRIRRLRLICGFALIFVLAYAVRAREMSTLTLATLGCFPLALLSAVFGNAFAFDRGGALGYLHLPVPKFFVFLAKNIVCGAVTLVLTTVAAVPVAIALGPRSLSALLPGLVFFLYLLFGFLALGNLTSVYFPKAIDPQSVFGWLSPPASVPLVLVTAGAMGGVPLIVFLGGRPTEFVVFMSLALVLAVSAWLSSLFVAAAVLRRRDLLLSEAS